ncbi:fibrillarin-like rRNA/tRNA 2'-O-methyltransferase [Candidatus Bathyarchaeota archaeon]|nr:fibrillarin-like rRNA/tRNA 2'-O-methyltransferase [Candidatus Bathyarchaeota archaeon]
MRLKKDTINRNLQHQQPIDTLIETRSKKGNLGEKNVGINVKEHSRFPEIYWVTLEDGSRNLCTKNLVPGNAVYGEKLIKYEGNEYRIWNPFRSKLAAAIFNGLKTVPISLNKRVLYLGAASGTTASHISDIVGENGYVYCVEFSSRSLRDLVNNVCILRYNMSPILSDARLPNSYSRMVEGVDVIYCDVAQPEQARLLADNADVFLADGGWVMLAIKSQSIDVTKEPSDIYKREVEVLISRGFLEDQIINLEPFDKAHAMVVAKNKK